MNHQTHRQSLSMAGRIGSFFSRLFGRQPISARMTDPKAILREPFVQRGIAAKRALGDNLDGIDARDLLVELELQRFKSEQERG